MKKGNDAVGIELIIHWPEDKHWILEVAQGIAKIRGMPVEELIPELVENELEGWDGSGELNHCLEQRLKRETKEKRH
jgi:hypothetical protein